MILPMGMWCREAQAVGSHTGCAGTTEGDSFTAITDRIEVLVRGGQEEELPRELGEYCGGCEHEGRKGLVEGVLRFVQRDFAGAVRVFHEAAARLGVEERPGPESIYTRAFLTAQLVAGRHEKPATALGYGFYRENLAALQEVDGALAEEVRRATWPEGYALVEYWAGLHLLELSSRTLLTLGEETRGKLEEHVSSRAPITFAGIMTGQELRYCLERPASLLHGMVRAHYVFEPDASKIRLLLHLFDLSRQLRGREATIFGGAGLERRVAEVFGTVRYPRPQLVVGDRAAVLPQVQQIEELTDTSEAERRVRAYYGGEEFRQRLRGIAAGEAPPRVLVDTCRWTTFLKYCAADFEKAFGQVGCQTQFLIEEDDAQAIGPRLYWRELEGFWPDVIFRVSHARASAPYLPRELSVICYMQDTCGPILVLPDLREQVSEQDLFVCVVEQYRRYLADKGVRGEQTCVLPAPADETMFHPLDERHEQAGAYRVDVSYVKHGNSDAETVWREWLRDAGLGQPSQPVVWEVRRFFEGLYDTLVGRPEARWYETDLVELARRKLGEAVTGAAWERLRGVVTTFYVQVYSCLRRAYYVRPLAGREFSLRLYGKGWEKDPWLQEYAAGPAARGEQLNLVYNFSRINLHLHPCATMHPRLVECALAGGFMLVADQTAGKDWEPARRYFEEGKEAVFFDTAEDLVEKIGYYLAHEPERRRLAGAMRARALAARTCVAGAKTVLAQWRRVLQRSLDQRG